MSADRLDRRFLIAGAGPDAVRLALELADAGLPVTLATSGVLSPVPGGARASTLYDEVPLLTALLNHPLVEVLEGTAVETVSNRADGLEAVLRRAPQPVDPSRCTACGKCVPVCPVEIPAEKGGVARRAVTLPPSDLGPSIARIEKAGRAPCRTACPIGVNAQGYVALIAKGKYREALELVRDRNPLPGICGRVCTHPCEASCRRGEVDEPVAICRLKRFVADVELADRVPFSYPSPAVERAESVAVVGSGPAGLTAAYDLRRRGYRVTVFEALPVAGGLLRTGIPSYRLPREILDYEIGLFAATGIDFRTGVRIGAEHGVDGLFRDGFRAVVVATGAPRDRRAGVPGEDLGGVHGVLSYLRGVNLGEPVPTGRRVVVVGGGNSAIDAARTAIRQGAKEVAILYRRGEEEMPALEEEVEAARAEGVAFTFLANPVACLGAAGRVASLRCVRMALGAPDASGRRRPEPIAGSEHEIPADTVIFAIGQEGDDRVCAGLEGVAVREGRIAVDERQATGRRGVFAAGDAVRGPDSVIWAMAEGQRAALAVHEFLGGDAASWPDWTRTDYDRAQPRRPGLRKAARKKVPHLAMGKRRSGFEEVEHAFRGKDAVAEAARCLQCGVCCECGECVKACGEARAIDHAGIVEMPALPLLGAARLDAAEPIGSGAAHLLLDAGAQGAARHTVPTAAAILDALAGSLHEPKTFRRRAVTGDARTVSVFLCTCNGSVRHRGILEPLAAELAGLPDVAAVRIVNAACQEDGARLMAPHLFEGRSDRVLLASCLCCPLEILCGSCSHQRARCKGNLYGGHGVPLHRLETVNLRDEVLNQEALDGSEALRLARRLLRAGLGRVLEAPPEPKADDTPAAAEGRADRPVPLPLPGHANTPAVIAAELCRGCGTCAKDCPQEAITMVSRDVGVPLARVAPALCTLCGRCLAVCPTGAPDAPFEGHRQIRAALAAAFAGEARR